MDELVQTLNKRRKIATYVVVAFAIVAIVVSYSFEIAAPTYFDGKYNMQIANGLIVYKVIELLILYYILFHRHVVFLKDNTYNDKQFSKIKKHTKLLYFLIPQGNTIFGIIAFKLSDNIIYFINFSFIALITLFLIKPESLDI